MKTLSLTAALAAVAFAATPAVAAPTDPAAELAKAVEGRVEGKPVDCLYLRDIRSTRVIPRTAIVYETLDGTRYVNRPRSGARSLNAFDILLTDTRSSQLCSIDVVRLLDQSTRFQTGFVGLGEFVPYPRPGREAR